MSLEFWSGLTQVDAFEILGKMCWPIQFMFDPRAQRIGGVGFAVGNEHPARRRRRGPQPRQDFIGVGVRGAGGELDDFRADAYVLPEDP